MAYKVVLDFIDYLGDGKAYKSGDVYPHSGVADEARVKHLMTPTNQRGSLLEIVEDEKSAPAPKEKSKKKTKDE